MIRVNGQDMEYEQMTVAELLHKKGFRVDTVAVEMNEKIVSKKYYESVTINDEDTVEVISFVGGG